MANLTFSNTNPESINPQPYNLQSTLAKRVLTHTIRAMDPTSPNNSPLLSPTKARQQAVQAKDWAYVNSWLSRHYAPKRVPTFERNEDTLRTLLTLAAANDAADEEATLLNRAREESVQEFKTREDAGPKTKKEVLDAVEYSLDENGARDLEDLAETTTVLGALGSGTHELGQSIIELTREEFDTQGQLDKVEALHKYLEKELASLRDQLDELRFDSVYEVPLELPALTAEWSRGTKILASKIGEYHDRAASLERTKPNGPTIEELMAEEKDVSRAKETVKSLEARVKAFHDLPKDIQGARFRYKELEQELAQLSRQRDTHV